MNTLGVAIVGRPNVGKSSLFNRLIKKRKALVLDIPGVTRDRIVDTIQFDRIEQPVRLIDTGGLGEGRFSKEIEEQVQSALKEVQVILFVVDGLAGIVSEDRDVLQYLRKNKHLSDKKVFLVVNKAELEKTQLITSEFARFGIPEMVTISAAHGIGIEELVDDVEKALIEMGANSQDWDMPPEAQEKAEYKIALLGKPNAGKSTLFNVLFGDQRVLTSPIAGTTVDSLSETLMLGKVPIELIDTAGLRRRSKTEQGIEVPSVVQAKKAVERSDLAILVIDGVGGVVDQDEKIAGLIEESGSSVVIAINKWDLQNEKTGISKKEFEKEVRHKLRFLSHAPVVFISAKESKGIGNLVRLSLQILSKRYQRVGTREFSDWIRDLVDAHNTQRAKVYYSHQTGVSPPTFVCHVNDTGKIHFSLERYLISHIRKRYSWDGTPIRIKFEKSKNRQRGE